MQWVTRKLGETFRQGLFFCPPQTTRCPAESATASLSTALKSAALIHLVNVLIVTR